MSNIDNLNNITNELILNYDEKFNKLYNEKNIVDSGIMNKEELINKYNDETELKDKYITYLKYTLLLLFIIAILKILNIINVIDNTMLLYNLAFFITVFLLIILYYKYIVFNNININATSAYAINMPKYSLSLLGINTMPYKCPVKCDKDNKNNKDNKDNKDNFDGNNNLKQYDNIINNAKLSGKGDNPTLKINNQRDIWKFGNDNTNPTLKIDDNNNENNISTTYPYSVYYKCDSLNGNNSGLPNKEVNKYSTVPCNYRENYNESEKYICTTDPNKIDGDISKYCTNITSS